MCLARQKYIGIESFESHACSGSDSSLLLVLATTGVAGFLSFLFLLIHVWRNSNSLSKTLLVATLVHSMFSNSLFYPWILGYIVIAFSLSLRSEVEVSRRRRSRYRIFRRRRCRHGKSLHARRSCSRFVVEIERYVGRRRRPWTFCQPTRDAQGPRNVRGPAKEVA